jgi:hypothetical protein
MTRERTEPGAGGQKPPSREATLLGVAPAANQAAGGAPIVSVVPVRERTALGVGITPAPETPEPPVAPPAAEKSIAVDLVVKKREAAPAAPEPELSWPDPVQVKREAEPPAAAKPAAAQPEGAKVEIAKLEAEPSVAEQSEDDMPETEPPLAPRRRRRVWPVILLLLVAVAVGVYVKRDRVPWWKLRALVASVFH